VLTTVGCGLGGEPARFEVVAVDVAPRGSGLDVRVDQQLELSRPARRAIRNGVTLVLDLSLEIRDGSNLTLVATETRGFEIRYLPLSQRYELREVGGGDPRTYPRLRHVLRALGNLRLDLDSAPLAPGAYECRARLRLDRASLPGPMQLPALLSRAWRHDSEWTQWPFRISA